MLIDLLFLFLALVVSAALYPFWIKFVYSFQMGEKIREDGPQTHLKKSGTPTMGGLVFILTVSLITFVFNRSRNQTLFPVFVASLAGLFGLIEDFTKVFKSPASQEGQNPLKILLLGFFSRLLKFPSKVLSRFLSFFRISRVFDFFKELFSTLGSRTDRGLQSYQKFLFHLTIGGFVAYWTYFKLGWTTIWFPLVGDVNLGFFYPLFIVFLFVTILNFVAFTDGLDGLAGGMSLITFCAYWVLAGLLGYYSLSKFIATFVGALIPFLYFNIYPARVFMGNVGSHVLGATLVTLAIIMHREFALFILLAVFIVDGISSPLQSLSVKLTKKRLFRMAPLHHHFELLGWPETKVTMRFWLFDIFFAFLGIFVALL